jgi:phosphate-selective porin OprO/OprP
MHMKKRSIYFLLVFAAMVLCQLSPLSAAPAEDTDARIEKLESQLRALQAELEALKAERAAPVDEKQVEAMVDKVLSERPRPELGPTDFRVFWKEGLRLETPNKDFTMKVGGRIMNDWGWISEDDGIKADADIGDQEDGVEFRRARLYISGLIYGNIEYKLQFDFAGGDADLKDAYIATRLPIGKIKVGHFKEPFGLEELTSSKYITFLERSLPTEAFSPSRNAGVMLYDSALDERMTWAAGFFREADDNGNIEDDGGYSVTGRVTGLPLYADDGASLVHVGASYSYRDTTRDTSDGGLDADAARFRSRPEAHLFDRFVDTGNFASDRVDLVGLEGAWVEGPLSVQGEYMFANADVSSDGNFDGYYVQASYFLTGEHRKYKPSAGAFSRVKPKNNFGLKDGLGAWEVALRYSSLDLDDGEIAGGELDSVTAGLNWYLNPNMRIMWNYIHAQKDGVGDADMVLMRWQVDF